MLCTNKLQDLRKQKTRFLSRLLYMYTHLLITTTVCLHSQNPGTDQKQELKYINSPLPSKAKCSTLGTAKRVLVRSAVHCRCFHFSFFLCFFSFFSFRYLWHDYNPKWHSIFESWIGKQTLFCLELLEPYHNINSQSWIICGMQLCYSQLHLFQNGKKIPTWRSGAEKTISSCAGTVCPNENLINILWTPRTHGKMKVLHPQKHGLYKL